MIETRNYINDAELQAWLTSARAWVAAFPQFADLVVRIEARLLDHGALSTSGSTQIPRDKPRCTMRQESAFSINRKRSEGKNNA